MSSCLYYCRWSRSWSQWWVHSSQSLVQELFWPTFPNFRVSSNTLLVGANQASIESEKKSFNPWGPAWEFQKPFFRANQRWIRWFFPSQYPPGSCKPEPCSNPSLKLCIQGCWFWMSCVFKPANDAFKGEHKEIALQPVNLLVLIWPRSDIVPMRPGPRPSSAAAAVRPRVLLSHLLWISDCLNNHPSGRDLLGETSWKCHSKKTSRAAATVPQMQQQLRCKFFMRVNGLALVCLRLSSNASMAMTCSDYLSSFSVSSTCKRNSWLAPLSLKQSIHILWIYQTIDAAEQIKFTQVK